MLRDFKEFVLRGNVVDLAIGVVIGAGFEAVVSSLVEDVITPIITIPGSTNFSELTVTIGGGTIAYGNFLNALISFATIAAAVFFFVVKPLNALSERRKTERDVTTLTGDCPSCLSSIPVDASVCAFCTRDVPGERRNDRQR